MTSQCFTVGNSSVPRGNKGPCKAGPGDKSQSSCQLTYLHFGFLIVNVPLISGPLKIKSQVQKYPLAGVGVERLHRNCVCFKASEAVFALDFQRAFP